MKMISARCWCGGEDVKIPVAWVKEGQTASCHRAACVVGCQMVADEEEDQGVAPGKRYKMNKYDPAQYKPVNDSTPSPASTDNPDSLVLVTDDRMCPCGCTSVSRGKNSRFVMGHDARLRGKLIRAYTAEVPVLLVDDQTQVITETTAIKYAAEWSTDKSDWPAELKRSAAKIKARLKAKADRKAEREKALAKARAVKAKAPKAKRPSRAKPNPGDKASTASTIGQTRQIKVGRWDKTGKVVAVSDDGAETVEYATTKGTSRVVIDSSGKAKALAKSA